METGWAQSMTFGFGFGVFKRRMVNRGRCITGVMWKWNFVRSCWCCCLRRGGGLDAETKRSSSTNRHPILSWIHSQTASLLELDDNPHLTTSTQHVIVGITRSKVIYFFVCALSFVVYQPLLVVCCSLSLFVVRCSLFVVCSRLFVVCCLLFVFFCCFFLFVVSCLLFSVCCSLLVVRFLLFVVCCCAASGFALLALPGWASLWQFFALSMLSLLRQAKIYWAESEVAATFHVSHVSHFVSYALLEGLPPKG